MYAIRNLLYRRFLLCLSLLCALAVHGSVCENESNPSDESYDQRPYPYMLVSPSHMTIASHTFTNLLSPSFIACWLHGGTLASPPIIKDIYGLLTSYLGYEIYGAKDISKRFGLTSSIFIRERVVYCSYNDLLREKSYKVFNHFLPNYLHGLGEHQKAALLSKLITMIPCVTPPRSVVMVESIQYRKFFEVHFFTYRGKGIVLVLSSPVHGRRKWAYHTLDWFEGDTYTLYAGALINIPSRDVMVDVGRLFPRPAIYHPRWTFDFSRCKYNGKSITEENKRTMMKMLKGQSQSELTIYPYCQLHCNQEKFLLLLPDSTTKQPAWMLNIQADQTHACYRVSHLYRYNEKNALKGYTFCILYALSLGSKYWTSLL